LSFEYHGSLDYMYKVYKTRAISDCDEYTLFSTGNTDNGYISISKNSHDSGTL